MLSGSGIGSFGGPFGYGPSSAFGVGQTASRFNVGTIPLPNLSVSTSNLPLAFTITPEQIAAAVAARSGQPAPTLTQAVTQAPAPAPKPAAVPSKATGIAAQELTGEPDLDRQILAARDAQGVSVDVGQGS